MADVMEAVDEWGKLNGIMAHSVDHHMFEIPPDTWLQITQELHRARVNIVAILQALKDRQKP